MDRPTDHIAEAFKDVYAILLKHEEVLLHFVVPLHYEKHAAVVETREYNIMNCTAYPCRVFNGKSDDG